MKRMIVTLALAISSCLPLSAGYAVTTSAGVRIEDSRPQVKNWTLLAADAMTFPAAASLTKVTEPSISTALLATRGADNPPPYLCYPWAHISGSCWVWLCNNGTGYVGC